MSRPSASLLVAAVTLACLTLPSAASAQGGPGPQKFENLQYFPKDIPRDSLLSHMRGFTVALGVNCSFCHVEQEGANGRPQLKPSLDDKPEKKNARYMLRMVDSINNVLLVSLPKRSDPPVRVACITCHRGLMRPATLDGVLAKTISTSGTDSAVAEYKGLRDKDLVSGKYDFSEGSLIRLAQQLAEQGKPTDALTMLTLDEQFYPDAASIDFQMAEIYRQQGDKDKAITRYRMVLQKSPDNPFAKRRLTELGAPPS